MAAVSEVMGDVGKSASKLFKSKPFLIACVGVGVLALITVARKSSSSSEDEEEIQTGQPVIAYAGYPGMESSGYDSGQYDYYMQELKKTQDEYNTSLEKMQGDYDAAQDEFNQAIKDMQEDYNKSLADIQAEYDDSLDALMKAKSSSKSPSGSSGGGSALMDQWKKQQEYQADLAQMKANSELYNALGSDQQSTKDALHRENMQIANKYGFNYDSGTGNYFTNTGSVVYLTAQQQAKATTGKTTSSVKQTVDFDPNVDYQARINQAVASGASQSTINQLQAQRQAKIKSVYGGVDPDKT